MKPRIYLRSDFDDYYDHHFEQYMGWPGEMRFERFTTAGGSRDELWGQLESMGFAVPLWGTISHLDGLVDDRTAVVAHLETRAHRGEGKHLTTFGAARNALPSDTLVQRFAGTPGRSRRWLKIGNRCWELLYTSWDWRSNVGDVRIEVVGEREPYADPRPLSAVDLVEEGDTLYAVDYNVAPGMRGTGMEKVLKPSEVAALINAAILESAPESFLPKTDGSHPTPTASNGTENAGGGDNIVGTKVGRIIKIESSPRSDDSHTPNVHQDLSANRGEKDEGPERTLDSKSPRPTPQPAAREAL